MKATAAFWRFPHAIHPTGQIPTVALQYDMERAVALDRLGHDEAWFGEHHPVATELTAARGAYRGSANGPPTSG